jgi:hypothetical protein
MDWISANWIWLLFAVAFVAMHMFGHGGHGGHGGHVGDEGKRTPGPSEKREGEQAAGHQH